MANDLQPISQMPVRRPEFDDGPGYGHGYGAGSEGSQLGEFFRAHLKLFLAILLGTLALVVLYTLNQTPEYTTKASVLLDQRKQRVVQGLDEVVSALPSDSSVVDTEVAVLNSSGMAYNVARRQGLIPSTDPAKMTPEQQQKAAEVIKSVTLRRNAVRVGLTYLIDIYFTSTDPADAQAFANQYAQTYLDSQVAVRADANKRAKEHLEEKIAELQQSVLKADAAIADYRARTGLNSAAGATLTEQEISSYNQALAVARAQAAEDQQRLASASGQLGRGADYMGNSNSGSLTQLRAQQAAISAKVAEMQSRYGPLHPELATAKKELDDVNNLIAMESRRSVASLQQQAAASSGRAAALSAKLGATEGELARAGRASVKLHELQSQLEAPKALLDAYQARLAQISTQSGNEQPDARIAAYAPLPLEQSSPNWVANILIGLGLGSVLGLLAVLIKRFFRVGIGSPAEVESSFGVDFLGALPRLKSSDEMAVIDQVVDEPASVYAESVRGLAASVFHGQKGGPKILALTSCYTGEGKTTTTIALARSLALRGRKVLAIDCDLQRPAFSTRLGFGSAAGLSDVLEGRTKLEDAIASDGRTPAFILPFGQSQSDSHAIDHDRFAALLTSLREHYDIILLDLPPILQVAEARLIAEVADGSVLLVRWKQTSRQAIEYAIATLSRVGGAIFGIALTQVPMSSEIMLGSYGKPNSGTLALK